MINLSIHNYTDYNLENRNYYENMLKRFGTLSGLYSTSDIPYIDSRIAENLYCKSFGAENISRTDSSVDVIHGMTGTGIKTFMGNGAQKIAEFNKDILDFSFLEPLDKVQSIAILRNQRIELTKRTHALLFTKYHCIRREPGYINISEYPMKLINVDNIEIHDNTGKSIIFFDGSTEYIFNISKSVLYMRFPEGKIISHISVKILDDPLDWVAYHE